MSKRIINPQEWIKQYDIGAMTPAQLVTLITVLTDDTLPGMAAEDYQWRLGIVGDLANLSQEKSGAD